MVTNKWRPEIKRRCQPYKDVVGQKLLMYLCTMDDGVAPNNANCTVGPFNAGILPYGPFCSCVMIGAQLPVLLSFHLPGHGELDYKSVNVSSTGQEQG